MLKLLKKGSKGPEVKKLQEAMNKAGAKPKLKTDSVFGQATEKALIEIQKKKRLKADGKAGPKTMAALKVGGAKVEKPADWPYGDAVWSIKDNRRRRRELREKHKTERTAMDLWKDDPGIAKLREVYDKNWKRLMISDAKWGIEMEKVAKLQKAYDKQKKTAPETLKGIVDNAKKPFDVAGKFDEECSACETRRFEIIQAYNKIAARMAA